MLVLVEDFDLDFVLQEEIQLCTSGGKIAIERMGFMVGRLPQRTAADTEITDQAGALRNMSVAQSR